MSKMTLFVRQSEFTKDALKEYVENYEDLPAFRIQPFDDEWWSVKLPSYVVRGIVHELESSGKDYDYE